MNTAIKEKEESEQLLEQKMERWFYLHDLAEQIEAQKQQAESRTISQHMKYQQIRNRKEFTIKKTM